MGVDNTEQAPHYPLLGDKTCHTSPKFPPRPRSVFVSPAGQV